MQNHIQYMRNNEATSRVRNKWLDKKIFFYNNFLKIYLGCDIIK